MLNRRQFLQGVGAALGVSAAAPKKARADASAPEVAETAPKTAMVLWYSQAGHTRRMAKLIAATLEREGLTVHRGELMRTDPATVANYDLLLVGSPVYYMEMPVNVGDWLNRLPDLAGKPAGVFITYGGAGSNPINAAWSIVEKLQDKGAAPVGMGAFSNMNTFAPFWLTKTGAKRILEYRHLPNEETFEQGRAYAREVLGRVRRGETVKIGGEFNFVGMFTFLHLSWWTKKMISQHEIDKETCIECGTCARTCPAGAIDIASGQVDHEACLVCMGCVNNCPVDAMKMVMQGKRVYGFLHFCKENNITIKEPVELTEG